MWRRRYDISVRTTTMSYFVHKVSRSNLKAISRAKTNATSPQTLAYSLVNVGSLTNQSFDIKDFILSKKLLFIFLVETWLHVDDLTVFIAPQTIYFTSLSGKKDGAWNSSH